MNQVQKFITDHEPRARIVTFAIHQTKGECIAAFTKSRETGWITFVGWNDDVRRTWNVTNDWVCIEIEE